MPRYGHRSEPHTQAADSRMSASVGARIRGSSRSSTRTSPGAWSTTPRMLDVPSDRLVPGCLMLAGGPSPPGHPVAASVAAEDLLGDRHGGHGPGPAGVEGQVCDRFDEFFLGGAVLLGQAEVVDELLGVAARGEGGDGDEAAFLR